MTHHLTALDNPTPIYHSNTTMKLPPYLTALLAVALISPALGQVRIAPFRIAPFRQIQQAQQAQQQAQIQQQLALQRLELQRLAHARRQAERDAEYYCYRPLPRVRVPEKYPLPMQPLRPTAIVPAPTPRTRP